MQNYIDDIEFKGGNISKENVALHRKCWGVISLNINNIIKISDIGIVYDDGFFCVISKISQWKIINQDFNEYLEKYIINWAEENFGTKDT